MANIKRWQRTIASLVTKEGMFVQRMTETRGGHLKWEVELLDGSTRTLITAKTPSDHRALKNMRALLRRWFAEGYEASFKKVSKIAKETVDMAPTPAPTPEPKEVPYEDGWMGGSAQHVQPTRMAAPALGSRTIGEIVRAYREACNFTRKELGEVMGVSGGRIANLENDIAPNLKISTIRQLHETLGIPIEELVFAKGVVE